ncbi:efflux transporter outer membrane subunit [Trinickia caryophylli]|uniref:Outer membrane protein, multidrug efflux system n=1 Tax=Trinickia caryophylli TaxID=28094 RepID=A0A1X7GCS2_TRICW|nr:efflux transporter outer membrane subunit [Trinickia caryophylli]PMS10817.1 RND transporter [Trinickia caryophylli]TRX13807.1 efflux transporter outer membrane subunit [Trinickia caryophylli]WQE15398.1 efflux transporter outer membrane subunit [Trinickia caryophylli]SMF67755.1 outer membrane protein, multidrug efflux system [Trinickia caryophylli]GLU33867.1 RND transporter [Trinickia caryophylli]
MKRIKQSGAAGMALRALAGSVLIALVAACSLEPAYKRPDVSAPAAFKEAPQADAQAAAGTWKAAQPSDAMSRGQWWSIFGDETLDKLEEQALAANQDLQAAAARVRQARAALGSARSAWFPQIDAGFGPTRERLSPASQGLPQDAYVPPMTLWRAQATASYEADLFGRVSSNVSAARADSEQSEALFRSVQLALQADVAAAYFSLRELDSERALYRRTVALREEGVKLVQRRFDEGEVSELDLSQAKNALATTQAEAVGVERQRAAAEHSLAILLGKAPAEFAFAEQPLVPVAARVPPGLPSALLERRPDIAAAERAMMAANARVGLAKSAFFPKLDITGSFGYESAGLGELFLWSSRTFLLGPFAGTALTLPLFDGGRRKAQLAQARAQYDEDVALYRSQVLKAFREVEDNLADLRLLDDQIRAQGDAVGSAQRSEHLSQTQYREGQVSYLDVLDSQRSVLSAERQASQLAGAQAVATVNLIRALGGGWGEAPAGATVGERSSPQQQVAKQ